MVPCSTNPKPWNPSAKPKPAEFPPYARSITNSSLPLKSSSQTAGNIFVTKGFAGFGTEGWDYQLAVEAADEVAQWQALRARQVKM